MPLGIPHSQFLSWSADDQDKAIAFNRAKAEVCDRCGSRESDWVDPDRPGRLLERPPLTPFAHKCHGCAEIEQYRAAELKDGPPPGVTILLAPEELVDLDGKLKRNPKS